MTNLLAITTFIDADDDNTRRDDYRLQDVLREENSPSLTYIKYRGCKPYSPMFPLIYARRLRIHFPSTVFSSFLAVLLNLSLLKMLTIESEYELSPSSTSRPSISLPNLTSLVLHGRDGLDNLLQYFVVPSLRVLRLGSILFPSIRRYRLEPRYVHFEGIRDIKTNLPSILSSSSPPLEILDLDGVKVRPGALEACTHPLEGVRELRLCHLEIEDTLDLLKRCRGMYPRLSRISLTRCCRFRGSTLVELIRSRNKDAAKTREHGISTDRSPIEEIIVESCPSIAKKDFVELANMTVILRKDTNRVSWV